MPQDTGGAAVRAGGNAAQGGQQRQEQSSGPSGMMRLLLGGGVYLLINLAMGWYFAKEQNGIQVTDPAGNIITVPANTEDIPPYLLRPKTLDSGATFRNVPNKVAPIWPMDSYLDIIVTLAPSFNPDPISETPADMIVLDEKRFQLSNYSDKRSYDGNFAVPDRIQHNGTLWGHFYIGLSGSELDFLQPGFNPASAYHFTYPLTHYLPKKKIAKTRNLLDDLPPPVVEEEEEDTAGPVIANYYHPNITLSLIPNSGVMDYANQHPAVRHYMHLEPTGARDGTGQNSWYYPILFVNTFWQLKSHMTLLNDTVTTLPIHVDLGNLRSWQFKIMASLELTSKEAARQSAFGNSVAGGSDGSEIEMIKEIFIDTNPILLAITGVVSVAHIILETLAFGSDIAHYRKKKDNVGISVRSILANVFMQTVILLYLIDNQQNTSWMILGSQAVGILIEFWKITTIVNVKFGPLPPGSWLPYGIILEDKQKLSETEEKTKEYDEIAFKYMYIAGVPLLIAYAIYSLIYDSHKSWYSYIITTLVGSVYAYGFLLMVPSLYINYRLKSVAHMPAKAMMYKFLNTFIDDLFAFTIKMPLLHRLATFRDDIIFFIYLYQRWAYRVDYTRVNEFGQDGEDVVEELKKKEKEEKEKVEAIPKTTSGEEAAEGATATGAEKRQVKKRK
ncbi:hypothetical protein SAPIO_CDS9688 [Scedosporium apiospermum]|uniref:Cleft lip and palate transmembrane protein 1 n=1 Tax=Pseudallescheria apiosperma TaxID=563466 RepID=A0A084FXB9_PSEDA|nr:uncharacterized protein SAPIO_CDS9688 [Scedosporium apiospermum]KEZ39731.1 hypothetical protein SAPIO_CDS9688 [Scedosporium apiospermum]